MLSALENDRAAAFLMADELNLALHDYEEFGNRFVPVEQELARDQPTGTAALDIEQV